MASLFKKPNSPFWYLRRKVDGAWRKDSTGLRHDDPDETIEAQALRAEAEAKELRKEVVKNSGWNWVLQYLTSTGLNARSIAKYKTNWGWLHLWLVEEKIAIDDLRYQHSQEYIDWRVGRRKRTGKSAGRNTAIQEIKLLSSILNEAVRRGMIAANPLGRLKLKKTTPKRKPELTDDEVDLCRAALATQTKENPDSEWMETAFEIALATGCRLRETRIPMDCIDLRSKIQTLTFPAPKGGEEKAFTIPLPSSLVLMFERFVQEGRPHTIKAFPFQPSRAWQHFFRRVGLPHLTFHCLRVTKVTRLRREGVSREVAMRLVNHSDELIHLLYDRHRVQDLAEFRDAGIAGRAAAK